MIPIGRKGGLKDTSPVASPDAAKVFHDRYPRTRHGRVMFIFGTVAVEVMAGGANARLQAGFVHFTKFCGKDSMHARLIA
jgi:hypothetical protein